MATMTVKASVRFKAFTPALIYILSVVYMEAAKCDDVQSIVITSANDSRHSTHSRHYTSEALDIRTRNFPSGAARKRFTSALKRSLGPRFTVLFESAGTPNQHIHIQPKKGTVYEGPLSTAAALCYEQES
tara:strand:+ start:155 stop:544 length:390 start_codon:yes stop_codon:yes gene_type:complete